MTLSSERSSARGRPLLLTPGEPSGIGPELAVRLAAEIPGLVLVADPSLLTDAARALGLKLRFSTWQPGQPLPDRVDGETWCLPVSLAASARPGQLDPDNADYVLQTLRVAAGAVLNNDAAALVTGPVHKGVINRAGFAFTGHTEFLAQLAGVGRVVMMLVAGRLRVALATTHLALADVPAAVTRKGLSETLRILARDLEQRFGIEHPRIAVLGLNPHAGEGGVLGREEIDVIEPVIEELRQHGLRLEGPLPADTAFLPEVQSRSDALLAMYHDQGLPVLKYAGFGTAVNVTLGLPFIRTSVDHGTALDRAGSGCADPGSLRAAVALARELAFGSTVADREI